MKDFYSEINKVLTEYEEYKPYHTKNIDWACDKISWCAKWKKLSKEQINELADRATAILDKNL